MNQITVIPSRDLQYDNELNSSDLVAHSQSVDWFITNVNLSYVGELTATFPIDSNITWEIVKHTSKGGLFSVPELEGGISRPINEENTLPKFRYVSNAGYEFDQFTFRIYDGQQYSDTAIVNINVIAPVPRPTWRIGDPLLTDVNKTVYAWEQGQIFQMVLGLGEDEYIPVLSALALPIYINEEIPHTVDASHRYDKLKEKWWVVVKNELTRLTYKIKADDLIGDLTSVNIFFNTESTIEDGYRIKIYDDILYEFKTVRTVLRGYDYTGITSNDNDNNIFVLPVGPFTVYLPFNSQRTFRIDSYNTVGETEGGEVTIWTRPRKGPSLLVVENISDTTAEITFTLPAEAPANGGYRCFAVPTLGGETVVADASESPFLFDGLVPSTEYEFTAVAYNNYGDSENNSFTTGDSVISETLVDAQPPVHLSSIIDITGYNIIRYYNKPVEVGVDGWSGYTINATQGPVAATYVSGVGTDTVLFRLSRPICDYEIISEDFTPPYDGVHGENGNFLQAFTDLGVGNSSDVVLYESFEQVDTGGELGSNTDGYDSPYITSEVINDSNGTIDPDYDSGQIEGSRSLRTTRTTSGDAYVEFTIPEELSNCWIYFRFNGNIKSSNRNVLQINNSSNLAVASFGNDGNWVNQFSVVANTLKFGGTERGHYWLHYMQNSLCTGWTNNSGIRPDGSSDLEKMGNSGNRGVRKIRIGALNTTNTLIFDRIIISRSEIGNNP